jgi:hypothetical protein
VTVSQPLPPVGGGVEDRDYQAGSIGAMFPQVAQLMEGLLSERNALEVEVGRLSRRLADVCCAECRNGTDEKLRHGQRDVYEVAAERLRDTSRRITPEATWTTPLPC